MLLNIESIIDMSKLESNKNLEAAMVKDKSIQFNEQIGIIQKGPLLELLSNGLGNTERCSSPIGVNEIHNDSVNNTLTKYIRETVLNEEFFNQPEQSNSSSQSQSQSLSQSSQSLNQILDKTNCHFFWQQVLLMEQERCG